MNRLLCKHTIIIRKSAQTCRRFSEPVFSESSFEFSIEGKILRSAQIISGIEHAAGRFWRRLPAWERYKPDGEHCSIIVKGTTRSTRCSVLTITLQVMRCSLRRWIALKKSRHAATAERRSGNDAKQHWRNVAKNTSVPAALIRPPACVNRQVLQPCAGNKLNIRLQTT